MTQTDTIAREHPLNEVECWQRAAARWEERLTVDPFAAGPFRSCLMRLMVAEETLERAEYDPIGNGPIWRTAEE